MTSSGKYSAQELLTAAIKAEAESAANYRKIAASVSDKGAASVFEKLAGQEDAHATYLKQLHDSYAKARGWPEKVNMPADLLETARANLFPEAQKLTSKTYSSAADALRRGIKMETDAIAMYKGLAAMASDQSAKNWFNNLVAWEEDHLFLLSYWLGLLSK
jgi:rubrerythrin